jgi:AraC-like DNA-binding protein
MLQGRTAFGTVGALMVKSIEWSNVQSRADLAGVETLHAHFVRHHYARHAHECAVIGLVEAGVQSYFYQGARHRTGPGGIFFVNPEEPHTGEPGDSEGYVYRALYPTTDFLSTSLGNSRRWQMHFKTPVIYDSAAFSSLRQAHLAVDRGEPSIKCETLLLDALTLLIRLNAGEVPPLGRLSRGRYAVRRVRERIDDDPAREPSLAMLATMVHMSPYHLAHVFTRDTGLPIHLYAETARIRKAKQLLKNGLPIADVSTLMGYADQSHFTRRYKQFEGVTPGRYQKSARMFKTAT